MYHLQGEWPVSPSFTLYRVFVQSKKNLKLLTQNAQVRYSSDRPVVIGRPDLWGRNENLHVTHLHTFQTNVSYLTLEVCVVLHCDVADLEAELSRVVAPQDPVPGEAGDRTVVTWKRKKGNRFSLWKSMRDRVCSCFMALASRQKTCLYWATTYEVL